MDALSAWRGKGLLAACIGVILAAWSAGAARADSLSVRLTGGTADRGSLTAGSPAAEFAPAAGTPLPERQAGKPQGRTVGNLLTLFVAGTVLFGDSPSDFTPTLPTTPTGPTTPVTPVDNPISPVTPGPPSSPLTPNTPPTDVVIIQGNPTPEPTSLLIGLIGSACAGAGVWSRRRKRAGAA